MKELTKDESAFEFIYEDKKYLIPTRLVAFYLSKRLLSIDNYDYVEDANRLLWNHYTKYINNIELCKLDAHKNINYIITNYINFCVY